MIALLIEKVKKVGVTVFAVLSVVVGAFIFGRSSGQSKEQLKAAERQAEEQQNVIAEQLKNSEAVQNVRDQVDKLPSGGANTILRDKWMRDKSEN